MNSGSKENNRSGNFFLIQDINYLNSIFSQSLLRDNSLRIQSNFILDEFIRLNSRTDKEPYGELFRNHERHL